MIKNYLNLIKPNIVIGNTMSAISGFFMATNNEINTILLKNMIIGIALIISASCILNNIIDRDIDVIMQRTKYRILTQQKTKLFLGTTILFAIILNIVGFIFLSFTQNFLIMYLTAIGMFIYIGIYSAWIKRKSIYSIIIGSISGSMPPMIGYCTVIHTIDIGAIILLIMFSLWQIPHSYAITIFRFDDYKMAAIPTFPIKKGIPITIHHMLICIVGFIITTILLTMMQYTSYIFLFIISSINLYWLYTGLCGYQNITKNIFLWARKMFLYSIVIIMSVNILLPLDYILLSSKNIKNQFIYKN